MIAAMAPRKMKRDQRQNSTDGTITEPRHLPAHLRRLASELGFSSIVPIPISARFGDDITKPSSDTPWYQGPALLEYLEEIDVQHDTTNVPFRFPVQLVNRPNQDFRGYAGTVASGRIRHGDPIVVANSGLRLASIKS